MFNTISKEESIATLLIALFICACSFTVHANFDPLQQEWLNRSNQDSVRFKAVNQFFSDYIHSEPDAVLESANFHYDFAIQTNTHEEILKSINHKADALRILGRYDEALEELQQLVDLSLEMKDTIALADSYYLIGKSNHYQSNYLEAVKYFSKSLSLYEEKKVGKSQAIIYNSLGTVYWEVNNVDLALETFDKGAQLARQYDNQEALTCIFLNTGFVNYEKADYTTAVNLGKQSLHSFESMNHQVGLADSYYLLAQSYQALHQIDSALYYVRKSLDTNLAIGNTGQIIPTKLLLSNILLSKDNDESARIVEEMLPSLNTSFGYAYLKEAHHLLYKCYKAKGDLPHALHMHEKYTLYNDSLLLEEDNLALTSQALQSKHDLELLNKELENEKNKAALQFSQLKRTFVIIFLSSLVVMFTVFYARSSIIQQRNEKNNLLKEIQELKSKGNVPVQLVAPKFHLIRSKIEDGIGKKINETDWNVLNILLEDPVISNKDIAAKAFLTVDGIGSCLRRMYVAFDLKESKYKKIALIMKAIKLSNVISDSRTETIPTEKPHF